MAETVAEAFAETAVASGSNPFLIVPPATGAAEPRITTYAEAAEAIAALRARYQAAGYGHGHRVALLLQSTPEFFLHYLALNGLGGRVSAFNLGVTGCREERTIAIAADGSPFSTLYGPAAETVQCVGLDDVFADNAIASCDLLKLDCEGAELEMRKSYVPKFEKVLPAAKVARYYQIENKIRAAIKYELAEGIPLVH